MGKKTLQKLSSTPWEENQYLSDGCKLYRVIAVRVFNEETLVELEDCYTLDVLLAIADQLDSMWQVRTPKAEHQDPGDRAPDREPSWSPPGSRPGW